MKLGLILLSLLITPTITLANIEINEIMYDLEGSDSKQEWIELRNGGGNPIDISDWRFNDGSNHTLVGDDLLVEPKSYVLLVSDIATYGAGSQIIDTVMSLTNTSKTISLQDENGVNIDTVTYKSEWGANGNGNSLQLVNGTWIEAFPTPLNINVGETEEENVEVQVEEETTEEDTLAESEEVEEKYASHFVSNIKAHAGEDRDGIASAIMFFEGEALGLKDKPLKNARYVWNFGDGTVSEGKSVSHTYSYVGKYIVVLEVSSGEHSASDSFVVVIEEADLDIVSADRGKIEIANNSNLELELSFWNLKYKNKYFTFPKGTYILPKHTATFPVSITELPVDSLEEVSLLYPNGLAALEHVAQPSQVPTKEVITKEVVEYIYVNKKIEAPQEKTAEEKSTTTTPPLVENLIASPNKEGGNLYKWLIALVSLLSVASLVAISSPSLKKKEKDPEELNAEDYKISS